MHVAIEVWNQLPKDVAGVSCQNVVSTGAFIKVMEADLLRVTKHTSTSGTS